MDLCFLCLRKNNTWRSSLLNHFWMSQTSTSILSIFHSVQGDLALAVLLCTCMWVLGQFVTSLSFQIVKRLSRVHSHPPDKRGSSPQLPCRHPWSLLLPPGLWSNDKCCFHWLCYRRNSTQWIKNIKSLRHKCWKQWVNTACHSVYLFSWARGSLSSNCWMLPKSYQITLIRRVSLCTVFVHSSLEI